MGAVVVMPTHSDVLSWNHPTVELDEGSLPVTVAIETAEKSSIHQGTEAQVGFLLQHLGPRVTAASLGLRDARQLTKWLDGRSQPKSEKMYGRLHLLFQMAFAITGAYSGATAARFLRSSQFALDGAAPGAVLRDGDPDEVGPKLMGALRAFLEG